MLLVSARVFFLRLGFASPLLLLHVHRASPLFPSRLCAQIESVFTWYPLLLEHTRTFARSSRANSLLLKALAFLHLQHAALPQELIDAIDRDQITAPLDLTLSSLLGTAAILHSFLIPRCHLQMM